MYCYLGLGSNLDKPERILRQALKYIKSQLPRSHLLEFSSIYRSLPLGSVSQASFCNMVVQIKTRLSPLQLLKHCQIMERQFGRVKNKKWGPRRLDVDIIFYENKRIVYPALKIPHPGLYERDFVLLPLLELKPCLTIISQEAIQRQLNDCYPYVIEKLK